MYIPRRLVQEPVESFAYSPKYPMSAALCQLHTLIWVNEVQLSGKWRSGQHRDEQKGSRNEHAADPHGQSDSVWMHLLHAIMSSDLRLKLSSGPV
jgi:hypothetical protein